MVKRGRGQAIVILSDSIESRIRDGLYPAHPGGREAFVPRPDRAVRAGNLFSAVVAAAE